MNDKNIVSVYYNKWQRFNVDVDWWSGGIQFSYTDVKTYLLYNIYTYLKDIDFIQRDRVRVNRHFGADIVVNFIRHLERIMFHWGRALAV